MQKFTKKPVVVFASQWFSPGDHHAIVARVPPDGTPENSVHVLPTSEGDHVINPGDWIITNDSGEFISHSVCAQDVFHSLYDPVIDPVMPVPNNFSGFGGFGGFGGMGL